MQGHFAFVGVDDGGGMAELVVEFHYCSGSAFIRADLL
jgi:hypothetical protein